MSLVGWLVKVKFRTNRKTVAVVKRTNQNRRSSVRPITTFYHCVPFPSPTPTLFPQTLPPPFCSQCCACNIQLQVSRPNSTPVVNPNPFIPPPQVSLQPDLARLPQPALYPDLVGAQQLFASTVAEQAKSAAFSEMVSITCYLVFSCKIFCELFSRKSIFCMSVNFGNHCFPSLWKDSL